MLVYGKEGYEYISDSGIHYDLLEGKTIGFGKIYTSNYLFILLDLLLDDVDELYEEFFKYTDSSSIYVDHMQMSGGIETCYLDENHIKEAVDKFESEHKEFIDFLINNGIGTYIGKE